MRENASKRLKLRDELLNESLLMRKGIRPRKDPCMDR